MALASSGKRKNACGNVFEGMEAGFVCGFRKQDKIDNRGGAHKQSTAQRRFLGDAQKVGKIAGLALRQYNTKESGAGKSPTEPVEGFAENAAQMCIGGRVEDFAAGYGGIVGKYMEVAGDAGNDGLVSFKRGVNAPFGGIQAPGELCVCFAQ